jgi:hypothetical protein
VRLIPAPRGTGIVAAGVPKKLLNMAGVEDCYTAASGKTHTLGNFGLLLSRSWIANYPSFYLMIQLTQLSDFDDETLFSRQSTDRTT